MTIDLCEHSFEEFKEEMGDIHLGLKSKQIKKKLQNIFPEFKQRRCLELLGKLWPRGRTLHSVFDKLK